MNFVRRFFILLICLSTGACQSSQENLRASSEPGHRKIIFFIPGYYGTSLVDQKSGQKIFLSIREALFGHDSLAYPLEGVIPHALDLRPSEVFDSIGIIPFLYSIDAYGSSLKGLEKWGSPKGFHVITHPYDWRRDFPSLLTELRQHLESLQLQPGDEVILVAHSMGALLATYFLRYLDQDPLSATENFAGAHFFKKAILAGAPFRGTMSIFRNTFFGAPLIPSDELLSPLAISSFPSTYFFLTPPGKNEVWDSQGKTRHDLALYEVSTWEQNHYGLFQTGFKFPDSNLALRRQLTDHWLKQAAAFHQKIESSSEHPGKLPILILTASGTPTNEIGIETKKSDKPFAYLPDQYRKLDVSIPSKISDIDGDGTVSNISSHPVPFLEQMQAKWIDLKVGHGDLIKDSSAQKIWIPFLEEP